MSDLNSLEDLKAYISCAFDVEMEQLENMSRDELENFAASMNMSMNVPDVSIHSESISALPSNTQDAEVNPSSMNVEDANSEAVQGNGEEAIITSFCEITGSDRESGRHFLEALGFDLDTAVAMFLESEQPATISGEGIMSNQQYVPPITTHRTTFSTHSNDDGMQSSTYQSVSSGGMRMNADEDEDDSEMANRFLAHMRQNRGVLGSGIPASGAAMGGDLPDVNSMLHQFMNRHGIQRGDADEDDEDMGMIGGGGLGGRMQRWVDSYDEDGIRRPDPVRHQQLVRQQSDDVLARAEDPNVEWMFEPARHVSYMGSLDQARAVANSENRWLVVNIQSHSEFTSHLLNRDVWTNETIVELFRTTFLFWQRGHTCRDGRDYMTMYKVEEDQLPHIAFIDPRTGAKMLTLTGHQMEASDMAIRMIEFADTHPLVTPQRSAADSPLVTLPPPVAFNSSNTGISSNSTGTSSGIASSRDVSPPLASVTDNATSDIVQSAAVAIDYGEVPNEPNESQPGVVKVSIKMMSGKTVARKYLSSDPVRVLFAVAAATLEAEVPGSTSREFDLLTRFPTRSLLESIDQTLGDCGLAGNQVLLKWL